jgi:hypothetical protein
MHVPGSSSQQRSEGFGLNTIIQQTGQQWISALEGKLLARLALARGWPSGVMDRVVVT